MKCIDEALEKKYISDDEAKIAKKEAEKIPADGIDKKTFVDHVEKKPTAGEVFDICDADDNGKLTKDEAMKCIDGALKRKLISKDEAKAAKKEAKKIPAEGIDKETFLKHVNDE